MANGAGSAPTPDHILQTGLAFWACKVLLSAVEMRVFTELAHGPENFEALAGRLGLHPRSARDFLDALVALGFLQRADSSYSNTPATDLFLDRRKPTYIGGLLEMANHRLYPPWGHLTDALRTGRPQSDLADGGFASLYADPARLREFLAAMSGISRGTARAIAAKFSWPTSPPLSTSALPRATPRPRSPWPTPTSPAPASISPKSLLSSRTTSHRLASPAA